jgi:AcrR family transcriptional regulator
MSRVIPSGRFATVVDAAAQVFITHGFRRAQVQDVADLLDLSKGSLYGYAAGKRALFAAALRYADGMEPLPERDQLPVPAPGFGDLAALVRARLTGELETLELTRALARAGPGPGTSEQEEFGDVVADLYRRLSKHRTAIKLVDRCAPEFPELHAAWFDEGRSLQVDGVTAYLRSRAGSGALVVPGRVELFARTVVEVCVLWAVHRHWDPAPRPLGLPTAAADFNDAEVSDMLVQLLTRAVRPDAGPASDPNGTTRPAQTVGDLT